MNSSKTTASETTNPSNRRNVRQRRGNAESQAVGLKDRKSPRTKSVKPPCFPAKESKQQLCLTLLSRAEGASIEDLQQATGWQAHSVRGFLSGAVKRKLGLALVSEKAEGRPRRYRIAQAAA
jgi:hypothetical protein